MVLADGKVLHCLWMSRDPESQAETGRSLVNLTLASSVNSTQNSSQLEVSLGEVRSAK